MPLKRIAIGIVSIVILCLMLPTRPVAQDLDSYLQQVIEKRYAARESFEGLKYDAVSYRRNVNGDWEIISEQIWKKEVFASDFDTRHQRVISVIEDGEPLEEDKILKEVDKLIEKAEEQRERMRFREPLDTVYFNEYEFSLAQPDSASGDLDKLVYRAIERDDKHVDGFFLINPDDYGIVYNEFELADRPTGVKMMKIAYELEKFENDNYYPVRTFFRGHFGFLFFNGRREVIEEFSDFEFGRQYPDSLFDVPFEYRPQD